MSTTPTGRRATTRLLMAPTVASSERQFAVPHFGPEPEQSYGLDRGFVLGGEYFGPYESEYFAR